MNLRELKEKLPRGYPQCIEHLTGIKSDEVKRLLKKKPDRLTVNYKKILSACAYLIRTLEIWDHKKTFKNMPRGYIKAIKARQKCLKNPRSNTTITDTLRNGTSLDAITILCAKELEAVTLRVKNRKNTLIHKAIKDGLSKL